MSEVETSVKVRTLVTVARSKTVSIGVGTQAAIGQEAGMEMKERVCGG